MHIQFYVGTLGIGGIETYVVRICDALRLAGWRVSVSIIKNNFDQGLLSKLSRVATINVIGSTSKLSVLNIDPPPIAADVDIVFATGLTSLLYATKAIQKSGRKVKLVTGVFSQFEFLTRINDFRYKVGMNILRVLGPSNIVFCTDGCKQDHSLAVDSRWAVSRVSPLLIDIPEMERSEHLATGKLSQPFKIISVGRIVKFKSYNFYMPGVIRKLLNLGYPVQWHVYGDGNELNTLKSEIERHNVGENVTLHGTVSYETLGKHFANADLYIGAGTTVIEASAAGLPAIVALDNNIESATPGYFCDRIGVLTSDTIKGERLFSVIEIVKNYILMSQMDRKILSDKSIQMAYKYSTKNANYEFNAIYANANSVNVSLPLFFKIFDITNLIVRFFCGNIFSNKKAITRLQ